MTGKLSQSDYELLSAYLDGELDEIQASQVRRRLQAEPAMQQALQDLQALDSVLDAYEAPAPPANLAQRIIQAAHTLPAQRPLVIRVIKWAGPLAAAAAAIVVVAVMLHQQPQTQVAGNSKGTTPVRIKATVDQAVIENLDFFKSYETVETIAGNAKIVDSDTMNAIARLESSTADSDINDAGMPESPFGAEPGGSL